MFGYVTVFKPELKIKDYYKYHSYYCGLCRELKRGYGFAGQMTLSYDMTFCVILLTSLYECRTRLYKQRCKAHPFRKIPVLVNEMSAYAAEMNILLSYYHLKDDWHDERRFGGLLGAAFLKRRVKKIEKKYPRQSEKMRTCLEQLSELEAQNCQNIDETAGRFGELMAEILVYKEDIWAPYLRRIGFFLGKFVYIMDAVDDIEKDIKNGSFNPLKEIYGQMPAEEFLKTGRRMLTMMISEVSAAYEQLPCLKNTEIMRNILYAGVWNKFNKIREDGGHADKKGQRSGRKIERKLKNE